jgi:hypothetical protein
MNIIFIFECKNHKVLIKMHVLLNLSCQDMSHGIILLD